MKRFDKILSKFNFFEISRLVGDDLVKTLEKIDNSLISHNNLRTIFKKQFSEFEVLKNKTLRNKFISKLSKDEVSDLANLLEYKIPGDDSVYSIFENKSIERSKEKFKIFLDFFNVDREILDDEKKKEESFYEIIPSLSLRDYQVTIYNQTKRYLDSEKNRVVMHMPTGAGKTITAMNLVSEFLRNSKGDKLVVWLAHNRELCEQAVSSFEFVWSKIGNKKISLQKHYGRDKSYELINNGVFVTSLNQIYKDLVENQKDNFVLDLAKKTLFVVFDEGHKATASTYKYIVDFITSINNCGFLGLTATPGRSYLDIGEDLKLSNFYLNQKVSIKAPSNFNTPIEFLQDEGFLSKVSIEPLEYDSKQETFDFDISSNLEESEEFINTIHNDEDRNELIIKKTISEFKLGGKILLFASNVANAKLLNSILNIYDLPSDLIIGDTSVQKRSEIIDKFKDKEYKGILVNCDILTTGFDVPSADTAIIARPVSSIVLYSQMCGRVIRGPKVDGGTENAKIIQVIDKKYGFRNLGEGFTFWDDLWEDNLDGK